MESSQARAKPDRPFQLLKGARREPLGPFWPLSNPTVGPIPIFQTVSPGHWVNRGAWGLAVGGGYECPVCGYAAVALACHANTSERN